VSLETQFAVARDVLNRAGLRAVSVVGAYDEVPKHTFERLGDEELAELVRLLKRAGI